MRLVTFEQDVARFGIWHEELIVDPTVVLRAAAVRSSGETAAMHVPRAPTEMVEFFTSGADGRALAQQAVEIAVAGEVSGDRLDGVYDFDAVRLLAPVPRPRRIRDYLTYTDHATGSGLDVPPAFEAMPICYKCNVESVIGPEQPLLWPSYTDQLDFELELGFFTSAGGRDLSPAQATDRIAGVTIFNDVSARDIQMFEMGLSVGPSKGKDFCTAMGPCVLTLDEVDEWAVEMTATVNGEVWASGTTARRQFSFAEVLAWASLDEDVYPGEFFAVGTIGGGCGYELDRWIQAGDVVELSATGVGTLRNPVGAKQIPPVGAGLASYRGAPEVHVHHG
ncbi:fumarylacetoacetate hydrolase family protein [Dietzia maris]|uniref:fumarylacetoacetate hydrolase family protein n=1 Tax=Dietzia maris TaxID=37915 RepID=UPI0037C6A7F8